MWGVVDLGCKKGGAIGVFRKWHGAHFPWGRDIAPHECLGIDRNDNCRKDIEGHGFTFLGADVLVPDFIWPNAEFYTAFHFFEHLPSLEQANYVLRKVLEHARVGVWIRMPSYENDETAGERLSPHGLRFFWRDWKGHKTKYRLEHVWRMLSENPDWKVMKEVPKGEVTSSADDRLVPESAPSEIGKYLPDMGPKPEVTFDPPLIPEWDVFIVRKKPVTEPLQNKLSHWRPTYDRMLKMLREGTPFTFSRWGDGEWIVVLSSEPRWGDRFAKPNVSCGKHRVLPDLSRALHGILRSKPPYILGIQPFAFDLMGDAIESFVNEHHLNALDWVNSDTLHLASRLGAFNEFVSLIRERGTILIGPDYLKPLSEFFPIVEHVSVAETDCWLDVETIIERSKRALDRANKNVVICCSAGPVTKYILHRLYVMGASDRTLIDTGAVWDIYVGVKSRCYHEKVDVSQLSKP